MIKKLINIFLFIVFIAYTSKAQVTVYNDGMTTVSIVPGCTVSILGGYTCQKNGPNMGKIDNQGTIQLTTDWINNNTGVGTNPFSTSAGTVIFNGTDTQNIGGINTTDFYNLTINNDPAIAGDVTLASNDYTVTNNLTMTQGNVNLNGRTLVLGTSAGTPGTLTYTAGYLYSSTGTFTRWISATSAVIGGIASNELGHFPMGSSIGEYRPLWLTYSADLSSSGTVSVLHDPTTGTIGASHVDATWAPNVALDAVTNSNWTISTANGFALSGATGILRFGGQGYGTFNLVDVIATLSASVVGTFSSATNANTVLEVNRTGLTTANFGNSWRIGTQSPPTSPLPIELLSFEAKSNKNKVHLKWTTATEKNNDFFTVARSIDAVNFEDIGIVDGAGNSTSVLKYSLMDEKPYKGISYYRLKQTDFNGNYSYSNTEVIEFNNFNDSDFNVFPNPANYSENINLLFSGNIGEELVVAAYDATGKKSYSKMIIVQTQGTNMYSLDGSEKLSSGIYMITATSNQNSYNKKLIVK